MTTPLRRAAWLITATAILALAALFAAACGGDDDDTPSAETPKPTRTPGAAEPPAATATRVVATVAPTRPAGSPTVNATETSGEAGFRAFAKLLDSSLQSDPRTLLDRLKGTPYTCKASDIPRQLGGPACDTAGQTFDGILSSSWRSSGGLAPVTLIRDGIARDFFAALEPAATDEFGNGRPRVYALSISGTTYRTAITGIIKRPASFAGTGPLRVTYVHVWTFESGRWVTYQQMSAFVLAEEFLKPGTADTQGAFPNWERLQ